MLHRTVQSDRALSLRREVDMEVDALEVGTEDTCPDTT